MSRASPVLVLCLIALFTLLVSSVPSGFVRAALASGGTNSNGTLGDENTTNQGDPDELDSSDGLVKIIVMSQPPPGETPNSASLWPGSGELSVLIQLLLVIH